MNTTKIPTRDEVPESDKWDLTSLYLTEADWADDISLIPALADEVLTYKNKLSENADTLRNALDSYCRLQMLMETSGSYAFLLTASDAENADYQDKYGRFYMAATAAEAKISFFIPELQAIPQNLIDQWKERPDFSDYKIYLEKQAYLKPFVLSEKEERLLALESEAGDATQKAFSMLTNVDINFGKVKTDEGNLPLTQTTLSKFLQSPDRKVREKAYKKFYKAFDEHKNTIATLYAGSVNHDIFIARSRGFASVRQMELFPDKVDESVYDNLVSTVRNNLEPLHKYYSKCKKILGVDKLKHYDVYAPLVPDVKKTTTYNEAVELLRKALAPLGEQYTSTLCDGLLNGWVDRYENKGKRSGAFSDGVFIGYPYILLNYKEDVLRDVFTLAHEGGHSMHSWYSVRSNPFMQYNYTIFEAEVASTLNEQLVFEYLIKNATDEKLKQYLICTRASDILATLYRQTMFAEFEHTAHALVENGTPLSANVLRQEYGKLLRTYFGPELEFEKTSDLEGLRIPHFYNAYYVYKYATGVSAAIALSKRILNGGEKEKNDYFNFLKSGGSRYPIEALKVAGVDMSTSEPIKAAIDTFADLVDQIKC